ncbi:proline--tRNA ligase [Treponema pallidum]|uniref:Proline--tRNA ligase n=4 Tax=Treponema pallidum TaxID=160 RepID=SYP_TREPA|nr:proline--tRNA ligase [Treponema pallidum]B2S2A7.1 RecName: Full=Proline--tRNA ligase; AltName: Full=Prolyl-tRNA synthetase; Short=ProRS [Treponema pallidum subsp. pallidum SS14]O83195.1 RecName: Full=Proline--tRNA ligase; AltName: Full=Prolyl-tRNA synthetase; Short=ProRS [Treponema pallidum subsp. pallidum str. Nichols]AAC65149.1 prolyl-tRNA synthetase (proS) [Treponema pallidum subsp. pallidum str. Nichols]ACD70586.1 prolyl-tRNA synthetase [Treponema pallidum subsp. pallidum SS14]AFU66190.
MSAFFAPTLRSAPADATIASHQLLMRAGYVRKIANGLFAYLPLGLRVRHKIEAIIREELEAIGCLECTAPVVTPAELWKESGRWYRMGAELLRAKNRLDHELLFSPTAEESFTALVRGDCTSYKHFPLSLYQINAKYRDEIRPRYGLMRAREFTMADAYSFHTDCACLARTYEKFAHAYRAIFRRIGLSVIAVHAHLGAMGGQESEEFMVESAVGDNTLLLCPHCTYAANCEKAVGQRPLPDTHDTHLKDEHEGSDLKTPAAMREVHTPHVKTIEELEHFLHVPAHRCIKTLIYRIDTVPQAAGHFVAVCIRGDLELNESKLEALLRVPSVVLATEQEVYALSGTPVGFIGPVGLAQRAAAAYAARTPAFFPSAAEPASVTSDIPFFSLVADQSVMAMHNAITGALKVDTHLVQVEPGRDFVPDAVADLMLVRAGDRCIHCGAPLYEKKGNELGHLFKLGDKYTRSMHLTFTDEQGVRQFPLMGCYGIGLDRTLASVVENHHDTRGISWPLAISPYAVVLIPIPHTQAPYAAAEALYVQLRTRGVEVLFDDRAERPGVKFADADLIGIPLRVVLSAKTLPRVECTTRCGAHTYFFTQEEASEHIARLLEQLASPESS